MMQSMTGFGKAIMHTEGKTIVAEIRSLNSKQLDLNTRIAPIFREKEHEIRSIITKILERGKIDIALFIENTETPVVSINENLAKAYFEKLSSLSAQVQNPLSSDIFIQTLRMPEVIATPKEELSDCLWTTILEGLEKCCNDVLQFRNDEGKMLAKDLKNRILCISSKIDEITPYEEKRIVDLKRKMVDNLENSTLNGKFDNNRLEQELIFYVEKLDITEEKVRLRQHCQYFLETMKETNSVGKKLGFITQEIGREINTIGSKANDFNIQQIVVLMKDEAEKIKEQLANVL